MDSATNLKVLKTILELSPERHLSCPIVEVHKVLPDLTEEIIEGSIKDHERGRLFKVLRGDNTIMDIHILPEAVGYLRELEEIAAKKRHAQYQTWAWDIAKILLGFVGGYLIKSIT